MRLTGLALAALALSSCNKPVDPNVWTLYRSSVDGIEGIHVASFDTSNSEPYNHDNCEIVRDLMEHQPGVVVRYWCSPGRFRRP